MPRLAVAFPALLFAACTSSSSGTVAAISLADAGAAAFQCRVSNTKQGGVDNLDALFDMGSADQGTAVDDPEHHTTWLLFGDTSDSECPPGPTKADCFGNAWYGSHGGNAVGYLSGSNYGNPQALCGSLQIVTEPGVVSASGGQVWAPDVHTAPAGDSITNYLFQSPVPPASVPNNPQVLPALAANQAISGPNEGPSGAFLFEGNMYVFYASSPGLAINSDCTLGLPSGSVSHLSVWSAPNKSAPPNYEILSRMDYNLSGFTAHIDPAQTQACAVSTKCTGKSAPTQVYAKDSSGTATCSCIDPSVGTGETCSAGGSYFVPPSPPGDWRTGLPMGGNFTWIVPLVSSDGTYLYLFGTGGHLSPVRLARLPLVQGGKHFPAFVAPYFADTPGLEYYDAAAPGLWDPSASNATPLNFSGSSPNDGITQVSVRWFDQLGVYLLMYSQTSMFNGAGGQQIVLRWSADLTGTWQQLIATDLSTQYNQCLYCSNASTFLDSATCQTLLGALYQSPAAGSQTFSAQAFNDCHPTTLYAPDMLPYLTGVASSTVDGQRTMQFTVSYLLSSFTPYDSVLFNLDLSAAFSN
jgi:hypothetical protein